MLAFRTFVSRQNYCKKEVFNMMRFTLPRDIYHGKGSLEALKTFEGKRAMICVGGELSLIHI